MIELLVVGEQEGQDGFTFRIQIERILFEEFQPHLGEESLRLSQAQIHNLQEELFALSFGVKGLLDVPLVLILKVSINQLKSDAVPELTAEDLQDAALYLSRGRYLSLQSLKNLGIQC